VPDDEKARVLEAALLKIARACEGGTGFGDVNWRPGVKLIATNALEAVGTDWRYELQFPS